MPLTYRGRGRSAAGGGSALGVLAAGRGVSGPVLSGQYGIGATVLTLIAVPDEMAQIRVGHRARIGPEFHRITAVDEQNRMVTIADPGLVQANAMGPFSTALLYGVDDVLQLPGGPYSHVDVRFLWEARQLTGQPGGLGGRCVGAYFAPGGSWYQTLQNPDYYWFAGGATDAGEASYPVGVIHTTNILTDAWTLDYDPVTSRLSFTALGAVADTRLPRLSEIVVAGG